MIKDNLILLRNIKGISQEELAQIIGISRQAYAKWEQGKTIPDIEKCAKLASFYGVTIDSLINYNSNQYGMKVAPAPKGKHIFGTTVINDRGQKLIKSYTQDKLADFIVSFVLTAPNIKKTRGTRYDTTTLNKTDVSGIPTLTT